MSDLVISPACECGALKCGDNQHSSWCPMGVPVEASTPRGHWVVADRPEIVVSVDPGIKDAMSWWLRPASPMMLEAVQLATDERKRFDAEVAAHHAKTGYKGHVQNRLATNMERMCELAMHKNNPTGKTSPPLIPSYPKHCGAGYCSVCEHYRCNRVDRRSRIPCDRHLDAASNTKYNPALLTNKEREEPRSTRGPEEQAMAYHCPPHELASQHNWELCADWDASRCIGCGLTVSNGTIIQSQKDRAAALMAIASLELSMLRGGKKVCGRDFPVEMQAKIDEAMKSLAAKVAAESDKPDYVAECPLCDWRTICNSEQAAFDVSRAHAKAQHGATLLASLFPLDESAKAAPDEKPCKPKLFGGET